MPLGLSDDILKSLKDFKGTKPIVPYEEVQREKMMLEDKKRLLERAKKIREKEFKEKVKQQEDDYQETIKLLREEKTTTPRQNKSDAVDETLRRALLESVRTTNNDSTKELIRFSRSHTWGEKKDS